MSSTPGKEQRPPVNTERPERGPVEELIAKRLRPLNKKVVSILFSSSISVDDLSSVILKVS